MTTRHNVPHAHDPTGWRWATIRTRRQQSRRSLGRCIPSRRRHLVTLALAVSVLGMWVAVGWVIAYLASGPTL